MRHLFLSLRRFADKLQENGLWIICLLCALQLLAQIWRSEAAAQEVYRVSSGTGFFVSRFGDIVTNAHVVKGCDTVTVRGAVEPTEARVVATDKEADLALLKTDISPPRMASIRAYGQAIGPGDEVMLMGYPEEHGLTGDYVTVTSKVVDVEGPMGETQWLQFEDAAKQGNSGGPLLDLSGNVVGVIVGKSRLMQRNPLNGEETLVRKSDIAITLPYLTAFLDKHQVAYWKMYSQAWYATRYIEESAKHYIVNVHCQI